MNCSSTHRHGWHRVVNAACDAMKNWVCIVLLLVFVSDASADERSETLRVYFIGNSVTDTIRYESFAKLAESRDQSIVWGRHMIPGAPLEWIHSHADSGFMQEPFGHYPKALGDFVWDAVSVQPFDRQLHSKDAEGDRGDVEMIRDFAERAAKRNPNVQIYIYARWPRITAGGKGLEFDKNDYDPTKPGSGADLSTADSYAQRFDAKYTGGWDATNETRDYFDQLLAEVRKVTPLLKKPPQLVPVGEVMFRLDEKMRAGDVPGYTSIYQLYRDGIHLGELGSYLVGCTFFATMTHQSPLGLPTEPYGILEPVVAEAVQKTVWEVVQEYEKKYVTSDRETGGFVIDVRSQEEWEAGHVERASHIPHTEIADRIKEVTDDKNAKIVLYCAAGSRAGIAKKALEDLGFTNVENAGGYDDVKDRLK